MSQLGIRKSSSFNQPANGHRALGFKEDGTFVIIKENGSTEDISYMTVSYIANRGVGLLSNLPLSVNPGDVYVTSDTFQIYIATTNIGWESPLDLLKTQIITDISQTGINSPVYQFTGNELILISPTNTNTDTINFASILFDENGISTETLESIYLFNIDANFIYVKRPDNYWVRSKIHKEVLTIPGAGVPE